MRPSAIGAPFGRLAELANGPTNIGLDGVLKPLLWRKPRVDLVEARKHILEQELDARTLLRALEFHRKRGLDRAAAFVSEHHEQLCLKVRARVLEAARDLRRHNVTRYTNDEQVAESRVENQLRRHPRVAATENDGKRMLALDEIGEYLDGRLRKARLTPQKARVAFHQARERLVCADPAIIVVGTNHRSQKHTPFSASWLFGRG